MHQYPSQDTPYDAASDAAGGSKPQEAAKDAASAVTSAGPDAPKEAAKDIPNPLQNFFGEPTDSPSSRMVHAVADALLLPFASTASSAESCLIPSRAPRHHLLSTSSSDDTMDMPCRVVTTDSVMS